MADTLSLWEELGPAELDDQELKDLASIYVHPPAQVNCWFVVNFYWSLWRKGLIRRCDARPDRYTVISTLELTTRGKRTLDHYLEMNGCS